MSKTKQYKEGFKMKILNKEKLYKSVKQNIENDIKHGKMGGAAATVIQNGEVVCDLKLGYKNITTQEPLSENTLFRLASLTKPVSGVACMIAVEKGYFSLDDNVSKYFPQIDNMYIGRLENGKVVPDRKPQVKIKMRDLLTHTNGIMGENALAAPQEYLMPDSTFTSNQAMVDYVLNNTFLTFEPTKGSAYSGYASFDIMALVIEQKSGLTYAEFVNKYIFEPLGIKDITFNPTEEQWSRMITMTDRVAGNKCVAIDMGNHTFEGFSLNYACAGASLAGSIESYAIFGEMLRRGGEYNGVRIISPESVKAIATPYVPMGTPGLSPYDSWGLGVRVTVNNPVLPKGCFGWSGAYGAHFWVDTENQITAVYMKNSRWYDSHGGGKTASDFEKSVMDALE